MNGAVVLQYVLPLMLAPACQAPKMPGGAKSPDWIMLAGMV